MKKLFQTDDSWSALILRVTHGGVMFAHGGQKLLGWFGGSGFTATMGYFTDKMHFPIVIAFLVIMAESLGSLGLIIGFLTRIGALGILCVMTGAISLVHWPHGFYMNWFGKQAGEGYEYHLLAMAISIAILIMGGGKWSVDGVVARSLKE